MKKYKLSTITKIIVTNQKTGQIFLYQTFDNDRADTIIATVYNIANICPEIVVNIRHKYIVKCKEVLL